MTIKYSVYEQTIDMFGDPMGAQELFFDLTYEEAKERQEEAPNRFIVLHKREEDK